jgi:DNA polymerase (family 10)
MTNSEVARILGNIARLLEVKGDNPFRIRAYLRAAQNIEGLTQGLEGVLSEGRLREIPGIGKDLAEKIEEILSTGTCRYYKELLKEVPQGVLDVLEVPSVGPKTAKLFFERLGIDSLKSLQQAARTGRLKGLPGIQQKTVENILKGLDLVRQGKDRMDLLTATSVAEGFVRALERSPQVQNISVAGSLRRMKETVRDIDILVASRDPEGVLAAFVGLPQVKTILARGETKASVLTREDVQVDLRVIEADVFGAALLYFTGSKDHNIKLRQLAIRKKYKINEYGLFDARGRRLACATEAQMYQKLGLDYIAPELREDAGEVEAAGRHRLPCLLERAAIRGDFHVHTDYSDGQDTVEVMARRAAALGYKYVCLTDHSVSLKVANGLDRRRLEKKIKEIERVQRRLKGTRILLGSEVEIDSEGRIDYPVEILRRFDVVVAAIHSGFKQSQSQLTRRLLKACANKHVHIIAHPTGKLWKARDAYELDFREVFRAARETNTALEINAHPYRLDLCDTAARQAKENGVRLAISTDSHAADHLDYMRFGVGLARRAWLEKKDVLNTLGTDELLKTIKK